MYDVDTFKATLEAYIGNNRLCNKNKYFFEDYKANIPTNFILMGGSPADGRYHYWWVLNRYIYDPTIFQFTTTNFEKYGQSFKKKYLDIPAIFETIRLQDIFINVINDNDIRKRNNYYYDQSIIENDDINDRLTEWYSTFSGIRRY